MSSPQGARGITARGLPRIAREADPVAPGRQVLPGDRPERSAGLNALSVNQRARSKAVRVRLADADRDRPLAAARPSAATKSGPTWLPASSVTTMRQRLRDALVPPATGRLRRLHEPQEPARSSSSVPSAEPASTTTISTCGSCAARSARSAGSVSASSSTGTTTATFSATDLLDRALQLVDPPLPGEGPARSTRRRRSVGVSSLAAVRTASAKAFAPPTKATASAKPSAAFMGVDTTGLPAARYSTSFTGTRLSLKALTR